MVRLVQIHECKMLPPAQEKTEKINLSFRSNLVRQCFSDLPTPWGRLALWSWATYCKILSSMIRGTWKIEIGFGIAMAQLTGYGCLTNGWVVAFFWCWGEHKKREYGGEKDNNCWNQVGNVQRNRCKKVSNPCCHVLWCLWKSSTSPPWPPVHSHGWSDSLEIGWSLGILWIWTFPWSHELSESEQQQRSHGFCENCWWRSFKFHVS